MTFRPPRLGAPDAVMRLRPSNVAPKLADSDLCVLNARDVQRSVAEGDRVVLVCEALLPEVVAGVLAAAKQRDAVVGLSSPALPFGLGPRPHAAFQALARAGEASGFGRPVFFRAGPILLRSADEGAVAALRETVFRYVDAGFTECCLEVNGLDPAEAAAAVAEGAAPLRERELSLEVTTRDVEPETLAELVGSLGAQGVRVDAVTLPATALRQVSDLAPLRAAVAPAVLGMVDPEGQLTGTGVRRVFASAPFCRLVAAELPPEAREAVRARALEGLPVPAALAIACQATPLPPSARERVEALAYHEALELLDELDGRGTGAQSIAFLAERSGY